MSRTPGLLVCVVAAAVIVLGAPGGAAAIPWDVAGAIPPSRTPPPVRPDPLCLQSYADDAPRGGPPLRFGVGPRLAGEAGGTQRTPVVPEDAAARDRAIRRLHGDRPFFVRLNRLFMADGTAGIRRFTRLARHFARQGLDVEVQVRYHPRPADDGDVATWLAYVRRVVRAFGPDHRVVALQITNEVNLGFSPNTSDGAYRRAVDALVRGVQTAKRESRRRGYRWQRIGFNVAWRHPDPAKDAAFWTALGRRGGARLRAATDYVGLDTYPGTFTPGILTPGAPPVADLGDAFLEGLAQLRECFMPMAGFRRSTPIRIDETGYPTGPGRPDETAQARAVAALVRAAVAHRGTYGITHFNWFGLRDNDSHGPDFQSFFGLLRDDYSAKPAFAAYRRLIARDG